jgi:hypothetical protein
MVNIQKWFAKGRWLKKTKKHCLVNIYMMVGLPSFDLFNKILLSSSQKILYYFLRLIWGDQDFVEEMINIILFFNKV